MRLKSIRPALLISMFVACMGAAMSPVHAADQKGRLQLAAGGNPAVCKANYEQCIKACDGMASCNNQCSANYRGCLGL